MDNHESTVTLTAVTFKNNSSPLGGGLYNWTCGAITLTNVVFQQNSAAYGGGIDSHWSTLILTNLTMSNNTASPVGGGVLNDYDTVAQIQNSIVWGNTGGQIANLNGGSETVTYSDIQGGYAGTGDLDADPLFVGAPGDLHLGLGSPAIDSGTNTGCPAEDMDGVLRPQDGNSDGIETCDMGAYEDPQHRPHHLGHRRPDHARGYAHRGHPLHHRRWADRIPSR